MPSLSGALAKKNKNIPWYARTDTRATRGIYFPYEMEPKRVGRNNNRNHVSIKARSALTACHTVVVVVVVFGLLIARSSEPGPGTAIITGDHT